MKLKTSSMKLILLIAVFLIPILVEGDIKANEIKILLSSKQYKKPSRNLESKDQHISIDEVEELLKQAETLEKKGETSLNERIKILEKLLLWVETEKEKNQSAKFPIDFHEFVAKKLCRLNMLQSNILKTKEYCLLASNLIEQNRGPNHLDLAVALDNEAWAYIQGFNYGRFDKKVFERIESNYKKSFNIISRSNHSLGIARAHQNLGYVYNRQGFYKEAEYQLLNALEIREKLLDADHPAILHTLDSLAANSFNLGNYQEAGELYDRTLKIRESKSCINESCILALNGKASVYDALGQKDKAIQTYKQALNLARLNLGSKNELFKTIQMNLLNLKEEFVPTKFLEKETSDDFIVLLEKAYRYESAGDFKKALTLYMKALPIQQRVVGSEHPKTARTYIKLAFVNWRIKRYEEAENLYEKGLTILEAKLGSEHPEIAHILVDYSLVHLNKGEYDVAATLLHRSIKLQTLLIQKNASFLPVDDRTSFLQKLGDLYRGVFTGALNIKPATDLAMYARLNRHGLLEEIEKQQSQLAFLPGPQQEIAKKLRTITQELASRSLTNNQRKELLSKKEKLEKELYRLLPELKPRIVETGQVAKAIPRNGLLIEYQRYQPFDWSPKRNDDPWGETHYLALVLKPSGEVEAIDLGLAEPIEQKIQEALTSSEQGLDDAQDLWNEVGDLVVKPLAQATEGSTTWFISPDAELNRIPFAALSSANSDELLSETVQLRLLTTGRELLDLAKKSKQSAVKPLVVANPRFDLSPKIPIVVSTSSSQQRSGDLSSTNWSALPGTAKEGKAIAQLIDAQLLMQEKATVLAVQDQEAPKVLHLASHAYFLKDQKKGENPLLRSGIVLAGANQPDANINDDGYLTALEVTKLDWKGTEMVVISGCESGKGEIQSGEGVYGLKRAIAVAGARSSLLSLWKVDDYATATFMESFYKRLKAGEGRADALAATQKEFRTSPIALNRHPYVWAAFQLSGDWRPIENF